jgi:hypothetical protein
MEYRNWARVAKYAVFLSAANASKIYLDNNLHVDHGSPDVVRRR